MVLNNLTDVIEFIFFLALIIQVIFSIIIIGKLVFKKNNIPDYQPNRSVSIIICAHNESNNLRKFLPKIIYQNPRQIHSGTVAR